MESPGGLATCFQSVVSLEEAKATKRAYYVDNGVLMRKWKEIGRAHV